jgi:hypothetical protein
VKIFIPESFKFFSAAATRLPLYDAANSTQELEFIKGCTYPEAVFLIVCDPSMNEL